MRGRGLKVGGKLVFLLCCVLSMLFCLYDMARSHLPSRTVVKGTIGTFLLKPQAFTPTHMHADRHLPCMGKGSGLRWCGVFFCFIYQRDTEVQLEESVRVFKKLWQIHCVSLESGLSKMSEVSLPADIIEPLSPPPSAPSFHPPMPSSLKDKNKQINICRGKHKEFNIYSAMMSQTVRVRSSPVWRLITRERCSVTHWGLPPTPCRQRSFSMCSCLHLSF